MTDEQRLRDYLKRVTLELSDERERLHAYRHEPIAIVGMSCRFPGGANSPAEFWQLIAEGRDAIGEFPADRGWDLERLYDPDPDSPGTSYAREGGFLSDALDFDPGFFGISPREAQVSDPQQRLFLEACWEALEDAAIDPVGLRGSSTGVFAGSISNDYTLLMASSDEDLDGQRMLGITPSIVSGRTAYALGLEGPTMTVDTACSASLVTLHLATQALRAGECSLALAGGVGALTTPLLFTEFSRQRGLAPDGRCKAFAEAANGVTWSEGVGVLTLERLSEAEANGHRVLATIRGSAVNQDGASNGLTAPNGPSQERVIRQALANARLQPKDVDAVEAHGTGTTLGDPIEAGALLATYGQEREAPLRLGSVKSNIGHSQGAAGVAGVIKMVMAMQEGVLPKTLHVDAPSSKVDWEAGEIELLIEPVEWKPNGHPRRAGVSSFGASGTNAHLILEEAPEPAQEQETEAKPAPLGETLPFVLSAKAEPALRESASRLVSRLEADPELGLTDLAHSLATTRSSFEERAVVVAGDREQLLAGLTDLAASTSAPNLISGTAKADQPPVFLFPGQGSQWVGMGVELSKSSPFFATQLDACEEALEPFVDWSLREVLAEEQGAWRERLDLVQPALFALMVSLTRLWQACGVEPSTVVGHSQGEIAAAHIAGALSLEDAARVIALRAKAMTKIAGKGTMASVSVPRDELDALLAPYGEQISLAAINGPASLVLSGEPEALEELIGKCEQDGIRAQRIAVDYAAHSAQIEDLKAELLEAFAPISPRTGDIPFHSTLTGERIDTKELDAEYWYRNLRQPVRLEPVIRSLLQQGQRTLIEIGPHPVLGFAVQETIDAVLQGEEKATVLGSLRRDEGAQRFALSLAQAHVAGAKPDWDAFFKGTAAKTIPLPTYSFQRKRYWLNPTAGSGDLSAAGLSEAEHPFLSARLEDPRGEGLTLTGRISLRTHPWLADHAVAETVLLPGAAFVELALKAAQEVGCELLEELALQAPLPLPESGGVALQVRVEGPGERGERAISIHSRAESSEEEHAEWTCHAQGVLGAEAPAATDSLEAWPPAGAEPIELALVYDHLAEVGFDHGPAFQGLSAAWKLGEEVYAEVSLAEEQASEAARFELHPALLDAAFHPGLDLALADGAKPMLPSLWRGVHLAAQGPASLRVRLRFGDESIELAAFAEAGERLLAVDSTLVREVDPDLLRRARRSGEGLFELEWTEASAARGRSEEASTKLVAVEELAFERSNDPVAQAHAAAQSALTLLQEWLAKEDREAERLVLVTQNAVATSAAEDPDLSTAPLAGLLRSASSEHPGCFAVIDTDGAEASREALSAAAAMSATEPQLALREGRLLVPRLTAAKEDPEPEALRFADPESTVLITGGLSGIGAAVARHLAAAHGARHLLLVSRRGIEADGAAELVEELAELGAEATVRGCDVSDFAQLKRVIEEIDPAHPLGAVVHSAGLIDNGMIESIDAEQLDRVLSVKVDAAWHLHALTADLGLSQFVLFSSTAGLLGGGAQANYAAANAFLDALAQHRQAKGLPASALAWGLWGQASRVADVELADDLAERLFEQVRSRLGLAPMSTEQGLSLFDAACSLGAPLMAPMRLDRAVLRAQASQGILPAPLRGLIRVSSRRQQARSSLSDRLATVAEAERGAYVLELVRSHAAAVLGFAAAAQVEPERAFRELGFDSLAAVELRNRLDAATGLRLATTIVFDYPTAKELAVHLLREASGSGASRRVVARAQSSEEPIAIVGMSCRYPGSIGSPEGLWELIVADGDAIGEFPTNRGWDLERLFHEDPESPGVSHAREGGFLHDVADFDAGFFGVSPREAVAIDPQQRLLLEASWEALERVGIDPLSLRGSETGIFAGISALEYAAGLMSAGDELEGYRMIGAGGSVVSGRVSYALGLEGPAITVDTACSASLVAIHLASQALRSGECSLALAGGVALLATSTAFSEFSRQGGLAPDGRCKSFAESADGTGWAEGVGVLALERLSEAEANGHRVLATIRGSAVNQDGASNGLTAPNGPSQERVIRQALANARLQAKDVDAVEAHGTGTTLGDPIEAGALLATYGQEREQPLKLGSIKSNIGHSQGAAGVAGVIKMVMAMQEGVLPKTLHVDAPSSKVDWEAGEIELLTEATEWQPNGHPRRAGVSAFGFSGTNAHLILEEAPAGQGEESTGGSSGGGALSGPVPLVLSAKSPEALRESASRLAAQLQADPELDPSDVSFSLATTRAAMEQRAVVVGEEREELLAGLSALASADRSPGTYSATARSGRLAYLFTGQGSQRAGMGKELYETYPAYREALDEACAEIDKHLDRPLEDLLFCEPGSKEAELLDHTSYAQPALFATETALFRTLRSFGLEPDFLAGHSVGEIVAAHVSGVLDLEDAAKLICARGKLMGDLPPGGAMLAIEASEQEARESIEGKEGLVSIAAINGPSAVVISGAEQDIEAIEADWREREKRTKRLVVSHAFHSPLIEPMLEGFSEAIAELDFNEPRIPIVSGELLTPEQATDPAYWVSHVREPVRFADSVATLKEQGTTAYLEIGPEAVLTAMTANCLDQGDKAELIATLREGRGEAKSLVLAFASAFAAGAKPDWSSFFKGTAAKAISLPTYPFQRKRYWLSQTSAASDPSAIGQAATGHPFLAARVEDPQGEGLIFTGCVSLQSHPWLGDHALLETVLFPGTAFLEMALKVGQELGCELLEELTLQAPLILPEASGVALQVRVEGPGRRGEHEISIYSRPESPEEGQAEWTCHARGVLSTEQQDAAEPLGAWPPEGAEPIELASIYDHFTAAGFDFGPAFQGLTAAWELGGEIYAEVSLAKDRVSEAGRFEVHPALFDVALQGGFFLVTHTETVGGAAGPMLPIGYTGVRLHSPGATSLRVRLAIDAASVTLRAFDEAGAPALSVGAVIARPVSSVQLAGEGPARRGLLGVGWVEASPPSELEQADPEVISLPELGAERSTDLVQAAHAAGRAALELIKDRLADGEPLGKSRLALLTENALAVSPGEDPDPAGSVVWGLMRSAQSEHPGRLALIDTDGTEASLLALPAALAACGEEPQLALRAGELLAPRVARLPAPAPADGDAAIEIDPERTVLITGATGGLGTLLAEHLVTQHGARRLLLLSRSGLEASSAPELSSRLAELGAEARIESCDVSDREQLHGLLDSVDPEHPLGAVIHAAGVIEDSVVGSMSVEQLDRVLAPKVDGAWYLHELTEQLDLSAFVTFSSMAATLGGPGQGNYAAANLFLDALAAHRQAQGLSATSIAWGLWQRESGMTSGLDEGDLARMRRFGAGALTDEQGLELFDAALRQNGPLALAIHLDPEGLRRLASIGILPPMLQGLVPRRAERRAEPTISLAERLAKLPAPEHEAVVLELVREEVAAVLGYATAADVPPERPFTELGFDSLAAVEMRNQLGHVTDMQMPITLIFDYPTAVAIARFLLVELNSEEDSEVAVQAAVHNTLDTVL